MPSETYTYTSNGVFPLSGTGLSDYTITQIVIAGAGGGVGVDSAVGPQSYGGNGSLITLSIINPLITDSLKIYVGKGGSSDTNSPPAGGSGGGSSQINDASDTITFAVAGGGGGGGVVFGGGENDGGNGGLPKGSNGGGTTGGGFGGGGGGGGGNGGTPINIEGGPGGGTYVNGNYLSGGAGYGSGYGGDGSNIVQYTGGGGGGWGGGGGGGLDAVGGGGGGGGGGSYFNATNFSAVYSEYPNSGGDPLNESQYNGLDGYVTITYTVNNPSQAICLLSDCDVLLSDFTLKNITEITLSDEVIGYLSKHPEKIKKVVKRTHFIDSLEETNKPYLIPMNTFGSNSPDKDIHLSGHHRIIVQTENNHFAGVQTFKLGNCKKETNNSDEVDYYHIILENRGVGLIVNNLPVEDCVDEFKNV